MRIPAFTAWVIGAGSAHYWHDQSECFIVKSIALRLRLPGQGDRPYCPHCAALATPPKERKAVPG